MDKIVAFDVETPVILILHFFIMENKRDTALLNKY